MSTYTYNITRWDGARFGPFATMEEAMDAAPGLLSEWMRGGDAVGFVSHGSNICDGCTEARVVDADGVRDAEGLNIYRYSKPPVVELDFYVVDGQGDEIGPYLDLGGAAQRAQDRFSHWRDSVDGVRGKSETFSVTIHSRPRLDGVRAGVRVSKETIQEVIKAQEAQKAESNQ